MDDSDVQTAPPQRRSFLIEIWERIREVLIVIATETIIALLFVGALNIVHFAIERVPYEGQRKSAFGTLHYWTSLSIWTVFCIALLWEIVILKIRRPKKNHDRAAL